MSSGLIPEWLRGSLGAVGMKFGSWGLVVCCRLCFHGGSQIQGQTEGQLLKLERRHPDPRRPRAGEEAGRRGWDRDAGNSWRGICPTGTPALGRSHLETREASAPLRSWVDPRRQTQIQHGSGSCLPRAELPHIHGHGHVPCPCPGMAPQRMQELIWAQVPPLPLGILSCCIPEFHTHGMRGLGSAEGRGEPAGIPWNSAWEEPRGAWIV